MKAASPLTVRLTAVLCLLLVADLLFLFIGEIRHGYYMESWQITEWLISYQGGFVRRGLAGELLYNISIYANSTPYYFILAACGFFYFLLAAYFIKGFSKKGYPYFLLPFVFLLGGPVINNFWVRKDVFLILMFVVSLMLIREKTILRLLLVNVVMALAILIHESVAFFSLPVLTMLAGPDSEKIFRRYAGGILRLTPAWCALAVAVFNKGTQEQAHTIWQSWQQVPFPHHDPRSPALSGAIEGISWTMQEALSRLYHTFHNTNGGVYAPVAWLVILLLIFFACHHLPLENKNKTDHSLVTGNFPGVMLFQLICCLPLFILGWDYGRWVFFWVCSSFCLLLEVQSDIHDKILPPVICMTGRRIEAVTVKLAVPAPLQAAIPWFIGVPAYSWVLSNFFVSMGSAQIYYFLKACAHALGSRLLH